MTSASHPRFRLLIGWCCVMTSALLIITVIIAAKWQNESGNIKSDSGNEEPNSTVTNGKSDQQIGLHPGRSFNDYIRLIRDDKEIWICHPRKSSTFSQKNSTVNITVNGLYYFHAQVTFQFSSNNKLPNIGTVTLRKNKAPWAQERILSKVKHHGPGTATMVRLVELTEGDSVSLEIDPINNISRQDSDTYWEIIFFNKK